MVIKHLIILSYVTSSENLLFFLAWDFAWCQKMPNRKVRLILLMTAPAT